MPMEGMSGGDPTGDALRRMIAKRNGAAAPTAQPGMQLEQGTGASPHLAMALKETFADPNNVQVNLQAWKQAFMVIQEQMSGGQQAQPAPPSAMQMGGAQAQPQLGRPPR